MGSFNSEFFVLRRSDADVPLADVDMYEEYFEFDGHLYEIESCVNDIIASTDGYAALSDDGRLFIGFTYYDGGCDIAEALAGSVKVFEQRVAHSKTRQG